jgi:hypothetical protein
LNTLLGYINNRKGTPSLKLLEANGMEKYHGELTNFQALQLFLEYKESDIKALHWNLIKLFNKLETEGFTPENKELIQTQMDIMENIQGDITVISGHMEMDKEIPPANITETYLQTWITTSIK